MREIKFRGKRIDNGEWFYGYLIKQFGVYKIYQDEMTKDFGEWIHEVDPSTVGQYTGLKDKNGTEIYEGDVMGGPSQLVSLRGEATGNSTECRFVVEWGGEGAGFASRQTYDSRYPDFYATRKAFAGLTITAEYHPVIGNIHDNPELLGGAE